MKKFSQALVMLTTLVLVSGCATGMQRGRSPNVMPAAAADTTTEVRTDRLLIWKAHLRVQVRNTGDAVSKAVALAEGQGGFVEQRSDSKKEFASLTLRIPVDAFKTTVEKLEALGKVTYRNVQG